MPTSLQFRRGTDTQNDAFTGAAGELSIDTTNKTIRVHDGSTAGGSRLATYADVLGGGLDSTAVINLIDSAYVQAREAASGGSGTLDSTTVLGVINAAYIQANQITYGTADFPDSAGVIALIGANETTYNTSDFLDSTSITKVVDTAYVQARQITYSTADFPDSAFVTNLPISTFTNDANYLDSTTVQAVVNASYIQSNQTTYLDSALVIDLIDSAYVQARQAAGAGTDPIFKTIAVSGQSDVVADTTADTLTLVAGTGISITTDADADAITITATGGGGSGTLDSTTVLGVIDAAYIQSNQITYNTADFPDSAGVIALIGANETTYTNVSEFVNDANYLDSTTVTGVINASYIQTNQTAQDFAFSSLTGTPTTVAGYGITDAFDGAYSSLTGAPTTVSTFTNDANYLDSTTVQGVVNASYVQSNQITYNTADFPDSAGVIALISANETTYTNVSEFVNDANYLDSTTVQGVINASYVQSNQTTYNTSDFLDSSSVTKVVDAAYVQARQTTYNTSDFLDSTSVTNVVDAAYVQARQTTYNTADFPDSAGVTTLANSAISSAVGSTVQAQLVSGTNIKTINSQSLLGSGDITITSGSNAFSVIAVSGQDSVVADSTGDTLTLVAGSGITITTTAASDQVTIAATGGGGGASNARAFTYSLLFGG